MAELTIQGGYTALPNKLLERIFIKGLLTKYESQVLMAIMRLTFGWQRTFCFVTYAELADMCGIGRPRVYEVCKDLHRRRIILLGTGTRKTRIEINRRIGDWVLPREEGRAGLFPVEGTTLFPLEGTAYMLKK